MKPAFTTPPPLRLLRPSALPQSRHVRTRPLTRPRLPVRAQLDLSASSGGGTPLAPDAHDRLLGELMFCEPDTLRALIAARSADLDEKFFAFIDAKVKASADIEERESLRLLKAAVQQLQGELSNAPQKAAASGTAGEYDVLIDSLVDAHARGTTALAAAVVLQYERIDMRLLQRLEERANAAGDGRVALDGVMYAVTQEMQARLEAAAGRLKEVLAGGAGGMRLRLEAVAEQGGLDDAFLLLLQRNRDSAAAAGEKGAPAAKALDALLEASSSIAERAQTPEVRLVRRLLRADGSAARVALLEDALAPRKAVALPGGEMSSGVRVDGKKFVAALRELIEKYGNVEKAFKKRLSVIGEESEAVARRIYGMEDKDVQDLQREAFHERRVSVWDLENVEIAEESQGRKAGWEGQLGAVPPGFNEEGKLKL